MLVPQSPVGVVLVLCLKVYINNDCCPGIQGYCRKKKSRNSEENDVKKIRNRVELAERLDTPLNLYCQS